MTEMRKDRRAPASLKVKYKSATVDEFIEQFGTDVSRGGIFIKTKKPLEAGALLKFEFQLQDGSAVLHGVGRVAWRRLETPGRPDLPAGMGIKFFKLSDHSRVVVERIESRYTGNKSRYEQNDAAEFAPPLSGSPPAADSGAKQLPGNGKRGLGAGSGPLTLPPPPAVSSIPPALADVPARAPSIPNRIGSRPVGGPLPKGMAGSFFPDRTQRKTSGAPASRTRDTSEFLASAFQAGAGQDVRDRAREQAERARRDPESVELARELFGDIGGEGAPSPAAPPATDSGGTLAGGIAAPSAGPERLASPAPESIAVSTPVPAVELPRSAASRSSQPSLADKIPSIEQLVAEAGKDPGRPSQRAGGRDSMRAPSREQDLAPQASSQPSAARRSGGAPGEHAPLTLAMSVPSAAGGATATEAPGRSRLLLFAALATTLTLGAVAVYVGMQRGAFGGGSQAAVQPTTEPTPPSAAAEPGSPAAEPSQPGAAAEPEPTEPPPVAGPPVRVQVQSKPRGAEVAVAGAPKGVTPLTLQLPSNVPVEISVARAGYATLTRTVTPVADLPPEVFELAPLSYQVVVTDPAGATISALGKSAVSPEPLDLGHIENTVTISIEKEGFVRASRPLTLDEFAERDGAMQIEITHVLAPLPAARRRAPRPVAPAAPTAPPTDAPPAPAEAQPAPSAPPVVQVIPQAEAPADPAPPPPEPEAEAEPEPPPTPEGN